MFNNYPGRHTDQSQKGTVVWLFSVALLLALAGAAAFFLRLREAAPPSASSGQIDGSAGVSSSSPPLQPPAPEEPKAPPYDFSQPVPAGEAVENHYFDDAAFVGDSRTDGFMLYSGIGTGENLSANGLSIFKLAGRKALTIDGEKYTLLEALSLKQYGKVYISLGINELGYNNDEGFYERYCTAIDEIRRLQPQAVIYIQGLIPVNETQSQESTGHDYLTNEHARVYNDLMQRAALEKQVAYLDLYSEFADESGTLPEEASRDGIHLKKEACKQWLAYLQTHTVTFETLYPDGPPSPPPAEADTTTADGSGQA